MRSLISAAFALLLLTTNFVQAATDAISGHLVFEDATFSCSQQQCVVTLLAGGVRPVQSVVADLAGNFSFTNVPRGSYMIRVEIEGFQSVTQPAEAGFDRSVIISLARDGRRPSAVTGSKVVDVSEFLQRYPKKALSYFEKGAESVQKKKPDEAVKYFQNAVELAPTFYEAHNQLALLYKQSGRMDDAEREFVKAHELNSTSVEPLLNLVAIYLDENDLDRAVSTGEQAVKANSRSAPAFFSLGLALYRAAQLDRAETALKRALDLAPKMGNVRLMLANVYLKLRRYDKTLDQLNSYIAENPKGQQTQAAMHMRDQLLQAGALEQP